MRQRWCSWWSRTALEDSPASTQCVSVGCPILQRRLRCLRSTSVVRAPPHRHCGAGPLMAARGSHGSTAAASPDTDRCARCGTSHPRAACERIVCSSLLGRTPHKGRLKGGGSRYTGHMRQSRRARLASESSSAGVASSTKAAAEAREATTATRRLRVMCCAAIVEAEGSAVGPTATDLLL